jgi:hypothetical protein
MKKRFLRIESRGYVWQIPADVVARNRVDYYRDKSDEFFDEDDEFHASMEKFELFNWYCDNMNWADVKDYAVLIKTPEALIEPDRDSWTLDIVDKE